MFKNILFCILFFLVLIGLSGGVIYILQDHFNDRHVLIIDGDNTVLYHGSFDSLSNKVSCICIISDGIIYNFSCSDYVIYKGKNCILCGDLNE